MIKWAGRLLIVFGTGHLLGGLALTLPRHAGTWFSGGLWSLDEGVIDMSPAMAAFWLTTGSFGPPLILVGMIVLWLDRRGVVPPPFLAWTLGIWSVVVGVILEPAPWVFAWVAVGLLLAGARRAKRRNEPASRPSESGRAEQTLQPGAPGGGL